MVPEKILVGLHYLCVFSLSSYLYRNRWTACDDASAIELRDSEDSISDFCQ